MSLLSIQSLINEANIVDIDQTSPSGSGSTLIAQTHLSEYLAYLSTF